MVLSQPTNATTAEATGTDRPTGMLSAIFFVFGNYPPPPHPPHHRRIFIVRSQSTIADSPSVVPVVMSLLTLENGPIYVRFFMVSID